MHRREPVDIAHAHVPGIDMVYGEDNQATEGNVSGASTVRIFHGCQDLGWRDWWTRSPHRGFQGQMRRQVCVRNGMGPGVGKRVESDTAEAVLGKKELNDYGTRGNTEKSVLCNRKQ